MNKHDKTWVCPLITILGVFDPKNTYFKHGIVERWVLTDVTNGLTGRIAAFIDFNLAHSYEQLTGGIGFFECIDDKDAAFLLFNTAKEWLQEKGMEAMDGPINFGETDKYWGLLVNGFTHPSFDVPYNHHITRTFLNPMVFRSTTKWKGFISLQSLCRKAKKITERMLRNQDELTFTWKKRKNIQRLC
jgi:hypothetical protein